MCTSDFHPEAEFLRQNEPRKIPLEAGASFPDETAVRDKTLRTSRETGNFFPKEAAVQNETLRISLEARASAPNETAIRDEAHQPVQKARASTAIPASKIPVVSAAAPPIDPSRVVAVTNRQLCRRPFLEQVERVCRFHPGAVILREKDLPEEEYAALAAQVDQICRRFQVPCILHTYPGAAKQLGISMLHLPLPLLRKYQGEALKGISVIGTSVHSVEEALEAEKLGASYLTAGHIYSTDCKKGIPPRGTKFLKEVCRSTALPVYAIGGIRLDKTQMDEISSCQAAGCCIMSGMMTY